MRATTIPASVLRLLRAERLLRERKPLVTRIIQSEEDGERTNNWREIRIAWFGGS